jgi:hypothetical protein
VNRTAFKTWFELTEQLTGRNLLGSSHKTRRTEHLPTHPPHSPTTRPQHNKTPPSAMLCSKGAIKRHSQSSPARPPHHAAPLDLAASVCVIHTCRVSISVQSCPASTDQLHTAAASQACARAPDSHSPAEDGSLPGTHHLSSQPAQMIQPCRHFKTSGPLDKPPHCPVLSNNPTPPHPSQPTLALDPVRQSGANRVKGATQSMSQQTLTPEQSHTPVVW